MKKKLRGRFFWIWIGLTVSSLSADFGLTLIGHARALSQSLTPKQSHRLIKSDFSNNTPKEVRDVSQPSSESLDIVKDGTGWKVVGVKKEYKNRHDEINVPTGVSTIGDDAFACCNSTRIGLPDGLVTIGSHAFQNCVYLTSINIPNTVKFIGNGSFWNCNSLKPHNVTNQATVLFDWWVKYHKYTNESINNKTITEIIDEKGKIDLNDFGNSDGAQFTVISNNAFSSVYYGSKHLTAITLPKNLTTIGSSVFNNCTQLEDVTFVKDNKIAAIDRNAFSNTPTSVTYNLQGNFAVLFDLLSKANVDKAHIILHEAEFKIAGNGTILTVTANSEESLTIRAEYDGLRSLKLVLTPSIIA